MLYTYDPHTQTGAPEKGLAASLGLDYSFLGGDLYILAEYLYSGDGSSTSLANRFVHNHYLFAQGAYRLGDYTTVNLGCMAGLEDVSFAVMLGGEHELFQGFTISLNCQIPLDKSCFGGDTGEFGPLNRGSRFQSAVKARLRF
jgi:hypothetical protein